MESLQPCATKPLPYVPCVTKPLHSVSCVTKPLPSVPCVTKPLTSVPCVTKPSIDISTQLTTYFNSDGDLISTSYLLDSVEIDCLYYDEESLVNRFASYCKPCQYAELKQ